MTKLRWMATSIALALIVAPSAQASFTATHTAAGGGVGRVTFTGSLAADELQIVVASDGTLSHNRFAAGDAGFASAADFDAAQAGVQALTNATQSEIDVKQTGNDVVSIVQQGASSLMPYFDISGGVGDKLIVDVPAPTGPVLIDASKVAGVTGHQWGITWGTLGTLELHLGSASSSVALGPLGSYAVNTYIYGGAGDDTYRVPNGVTSSHVYFYGGPGTDTVDFGAWTISLQVELFTNVTYSAVLDGAHVSPPVANAATGTASVSFTKAGGDVFAYRLATTGITPADITDAHIHEGAAGTNGSSSYGFGDNAHWSSPGTGTTQASGIGDPHITEPLLRTVAHYVDVHTTAHPGGEIRGQLMLDPDLGYGGFIESNTPQGELHTVERVITGSADDHLVGTPLGDTLDGGPGSDILVGGEGDDTLVANDGVADGTLDCGPGRDTLNGDSLDPVPSSCGPPAAPAGLEVDPAGPANTATIHVLGKAAPGTTVSIFTDPACATQPVATETALTFENPGLTVAVADGSTTTFYARAPNDEGPGPCSTDSVTFTEIGSSPAGGSPGAGGSAGAGTQGGDAPKPTVTFSLVRGTLGSLRPRVSGRGKRMTVDARSSATCPAAATAACTLSARITARLRRSKKAKTLGRVSAKIAAGKSKRIRIVLSPRMTAAWRKAGRLRITLTAKLAVPGGTGAQASKAARLKAVRRAR